MLVTEIEDISKKQSRIHIDHSFSFVLYKGELRQYGIVEGEELPQETCNKILGELLPRRAKLRAMNLLQIRDYTEKQLHDKLLGGGYPESVADQAVEYVKSFRYIDDLRYAGDYLAAFAGRKSLRRMEQDLQQRGVSKAIIEQAAADWQQDGGQDELRMACALLEKKHYDKDSCDRKQQQRLYNFLAYRGFSSEIIRKALQTEWEYS